MNRCRHFLAGALLVFACAVRAATPTIEDIWRLPAFLNPILSDNGQYFAVTMPVKGRTNLAVVDLSTRRATVLTSFEDYDVLDVHWVGNERLVFTVGQFNTPGGDLEILNSGGLFSVAR